MLRDYTLTFIRKVFFIIVERCIQRGYNRGPFNKIIGNFPMQARVILQMLNSSVEFIVTTYSEGQTLKKRIAEGGKP